MIDVDHLSKDRRDWLEIHGNQWSLNPDRPTPMSAEEKQALESALNPFREAA